MNNKYLGIAPYCEENQFDFWGRREETWALYDRISRNDYTVYYAASGEGKSSLIRAGLLPILRRRDYFPVYIVLNENELDRECSFDDIIQNRIDAEIEKFKDVTYTQSKCSVEYYSKRKDGLKEKLDKLPIEFEEQRTKITEEINEEDKRIKLIIETCEKNFWWKLRNYCFKKNDTELKPLFIFDQFEEVFTKVGYDWTDNFFRWLEELSTNYIPDSLAREIDSHRYQIPAQKNFKVLFSMRTEYLGELDFWCIQKHFIPAMQDNRMCLKSLTPQGAKEVVNLNKEILGKYADKIIKGCAMFGANIENEKQPCVYALVLSVVCQTLCELDENERSLILTQLDRNQGEAIDTILLDFYKEKLKDAKLDYSKDSSIINKIEEALVDENGKRSRRETNETTILRLLKWIKPLIENGLIKVIGSKVVDDKKVDTVEIPHDRLCKAIDTARKERHKLQLVKKERKQEWMLFGLIATTYEIITYFISKSLSAIKIVFYDGFLKNLGDFLCFSSLKKATEEDYSTVFLILILGLSTLIFTFIYCSNSKKKKSNIIAVCLSAVCTMLWGFLCIRNINVQFKELHYIPFVSYMGLAISFISLWIFYRRIPHKNSITDKNSLNKNYWPIWGGLFLVATSLLYLTLYNLSVGLNESVDSFWGIFTLPFLYTLFVRGFYHMETKINYKDFQILSIGIVLLAIPVVFFYFSNLLTIIPLVYWQKYGFSFSLLLIATYLSTFAYSLWYVKTESDFYGLTKTKRVSTLFGAIVVSFATFFFCLGYNPLKISPSSVVKVYSWRTVFVEGEANRIGIFSAQGDTIIPCCMDFSGKDSSILESIKEQSWQYEIKGKANLNVYLINKTSNSDGSIYKKGNRYIGKILSVPTLEEHLRKTISKKSLNNLQDSIDYLSCKLYVEMRDANIKWLLYGKKYDFKSLSSLSELIKLQSACLNSALATFSSKKDPVKNANRKAEQVIEDQDLIEICSQIAKSMLLCMIKDRYECQDFPTLFTLHRTYSFAFFPLTPCLSISLSYNNQLQLNTKINSTVDSLKNTYIAKICTDDVRNKRAFAWYDLVNFLCLQDISYHAKTFEEMYTDKSNVNDKLQETYEILKRYKNDFATLSQMRKSNNSLKNKSLENHIGLAKLYINMMKPEYFKEMKNALKVEIKEPTYIEADVRFAELRDTVQNTFVALLAKRPIGLYNNCLENICRNLIVVSAFRGYDVEKDIKSLNNYDEQNKQIFSIINNIVNRNKQNREFLKQNKKNQESLDEIIAMLTERKSKI